MLEVRHGNLRWFLPDSDGILETVKSDECVPLLADDAYGLHDECLNADGLLETRSESPGQVGSSLCPSVGTRDLCQSQGNAIGLG